MEDIVASLTERERAFIDRRRETARSFLSGIQLVQPGQSTVIQQQQFSLQKGLQYPTSGSAYVSRQYVGSGSVRYSVQQTPLGSSAAGNSFPTRQPTLRRSDMVKADAGGSEIAQSTPDADENLDDVAALAASVESPLATQDEIFDFVGSEPPHTPSKSSQASASQNSDLHTKRTMSFRERVAISFLGGISVGPASAPLAPLTGSAARRVVTLDEESGGAIRLSRSAHELTDELVNESVGEAGQRFSSAEQQRMLQNRIVGKRPSFLVIKTARNSLVEVATSNAITGAQNISYVGFPSDDGMFEVMETDLAFHPGRDTPHRADLDDSGGGLASFVGQSASSILIPGRRLVERRKSDVSTNSVADKLCNSRIYFAVPKGSVMSVFSVIPYADARKPRRNRQRLRLGSEYFDRIGVNMDPSRRRRVESFAGLLEPAGSLSPDTPEYSLYNPFFLDDPELRTGKHRTVITLPSFMGSVLHYSRPADMKKELNAHFREAHPNVDASITLSQIRNLKLRLLEIGLSVDLELSSVASAYVYIEKLIATRVVTKANRRLVAATCLFLAAKVNDPKEISYSRLLEAIDKTFYVARKDVYQNEIPVYTALQFELFLPPWQVNPHLERIISASPFGSVEEYLGFRNFYMGRS
ncbi:hypothetical protein BJ742DRAFT_813544 [Cladochytrium replicatum]|nr:hypothetical protein BJ742DRAFT_813544 [Cladochytrium replicatum]